MRAHRPGQDRADSPGLALEDHDEARPVLDLDADLLPLQAGELVGVRLAFRLVAVVVGGRGVAQLRPEVELHAADAPATAAGGEGSVQVVVRRGGRRGRRRGRRGRRGRLAATGLAATSGLATVAGLPATRVRAVAAPGLARVAGLPVVLGLARGPRPTVVLVVLVL